MESDGGSSNVLTIPHGWENITLSEIGPMRAAFHRLILVQALTPDRLEAAVMRFVNLVLGNS